MPHPEVPIIIGVADIKNRSTSVADAKEPAQLIHEAILAALSDSGISDPENLRKSIDSIDVVKTWTWPYPDLPGLLAEKLNVKPKHKFYSEHGGHQPGKLLDDAARRIARGEVKVAIVTGGEALASLSACAAAKKLPPPGWTAPSEAVDTVFTPTGRDLGSNLGAIHDLGSPIQIYPLYEAGFRAHRHQSMQANHEESTKLYADFSKIAEKQEYAWNHGRADSEAVIGTINNKNRMICSPYPLLMNAFNTVNLASACILTSTTLAHKLAIPPKNWIYPLGAAGTSDAPNFWHRPNFYTSPSINRSLDASMHISGVTTPDLDLIDIYSCFPIVPKLAASHLGLPITEKEEVSSSKAALKLTLLGGLTSFGGAGNNYSMHALTEMTRQLRNGKGKKGLVLCNGGVLSYQHVVVLSREPREEGGYPEANPLPDVLEYGEATPEIDEVAEGEAVVETYTVEFGRDGAPLRGYVVGRLKRDGKRFLANHGDEATLRQLAANTVEAVGRTGWVRQDVERKGRGLFVFANGTKI